jgi:hypothetical protein
VHRAGAGESEAPPWRTTLKAAIRPFSLIVVLIKAAALRKAEALIKVSEHCNEQGAEIPFAVILDRVTGSNPKVTDYVLEQPAKCPNCRREVLEKTLIEPK